MSFKPIQKLNVSRTLSTGQQAQAVFEGKTGEVLQALVVNGNSGGASPSYRTLISATRRLCKSPAAAQLQFQRTVFNLLACNQGEHSTAFAGFGKAPPLKAVQGLAAAAGFANWGQARQIVEHTVQALAQFDTSTKAVVTCLGIS